VCSIGPVLCYLLLTNVSPSHTFGSCEQLARPLYSRCFLLHCRISRLKDGRKFRRHAESLVPVLFYPFWMEWLGSGVEIGMYVVPSYWYHCHPTSMESSRGNVNQNQSRWGRGQTPEDHWWTLTRAMADARTVKNWQWPSRSLWTWVRGLLHQGFSYR
jgi:hypothetical protein